MPFCSRIIQMMIFIILVTLYLVVSFKPLTKEEQIESYNKMADEIEPFRRNLTECKKQVRASTTDVNNFLQKIPQSTREGKCFVACILRRNAIITNNRINPKNLLEANNIVYGENSEVLERLKVALKECGDAVEDIFEICEYASVFNDCMHIKMEHILEKATMESRLDALGDMTSKEDLWDEDDDEMLKLARDEL